MILPWRLAVAAAALAFVALAVWMLGQPVALQSDDALFFARGLERFSVLEFSPHFPGYPGFILLGRLLLPVTNHAETALFLASVLCALAIPPVAGWLAWRWSRDRWTALLAFAATLAQPLLPGLGLALLSDSAGTLFLLLFLAALAAPRRGWAGMLLGMAACCRPSYGVMIVAALAVALWQDRRRAAALALGFVVVCVLAFGAVLALEGWSYVEEGLRFLAGHTIVWGNTAMTARGGLPGWWAVALAQPLLAATVILGGLAAVWGLRRASLRVAAAAMLAALAWTLTMQNPDNLRHLAPVVILGGLLIVMLPVRGFAGVVAAVNLFVLMDATHWVPRPPPLAAAVEFLRTQPPGVVITNHGVSLLRRDLTGQRVIDAYYRAEAAFAEESEPGPVLRLSSTPIPDVPTLRIFPARFLAETPLYLYDTGVGNF